MKKNKILTLILVALGLTLFLVGLIVLFQAGADHTGHGGGVSRASTSIKFGADFYTSSAQYTALAANAVSDLYKLASVVSGIFLMFVGAVEVAVVLMKTDLAEFFKKKEQEEVAETVEAVEAEVVAE